MELVPDSVEAYALMSAAHAGRGNLKGTIAALKKALELSRVQKDVSLKSHWIFPENSIEWSPEKVIDYVNTRKEFDGIRENTQFQALLEKTQSQQE